MFINRSFAFFCHLYNFQINASLSSFGHYKTLQVEPDGSKLRKSVLHYEPNGSCNLSMNSF